MMGELLDTENSTARTVRTTVKGVSLNRVKTCESWISTRVNKCLRPVRIAKTAQEIAQKKHVNKSSKRFVGKA